MKKLIALLLCVVMVAAFAATPAYAANDYSYCVHDASTYCDEAMEMFAKLLNERSDGRFNATSYTPGTMGNETELLESVLMGDMTFSTPADTLIFQSLNLYDWASLPGLVTSVEEAQKYILSPDGFMGQMMNEEFYFDGAGVVRLAGMDNGFRVIASKKPVETLKDIQGLKTRVANVPLMKGLYDGAGVQSTIVDSSEVMTALQQGTVDAVENSFFNLATRGFIDMCPYVLAINFIYSSRSIICNAEWFDALSAEDQELVRQCAQEAADWANEQTLAEYEQYVNDERWTVYELSDEQYEVFQASAEKLWEGARKDCDPAILDALTAGKE